MNFSLATKAGIDDFILNELGYVKGLIVNIYKKHKKDYEFEGYEVEDLIQESYIWLVEKLQKEDKTDEEYLKKSITIYIKFKMANVFKSCIKHRSKITYQHKSDDNDEDKNSIQLNSASEMDDSIKFEELKHLCTEMEYYMVIKHLREDMSFREISEELSAKGQKISGVWASKLYNRAIQKFQRHSKKII